MKRMLSLLTVLLTLGTVRGGDWTNWRGPEQNGVGYETGLPDTFDAANKTNVVWNVPIGSRTTPIVQKGHIYFIDRVGEDITQEERVVALDEKSGQLLWQHKFHVFHTDIVASRLGWTSMVGDPETDTVFSHGTQGFLTCFSRDGKIIWEHSLTEEYGRISGYGGRITNPIVDGNLVIISMLNASWGDQATGRTRLVAFDKKTGKVAWWASAGFPPKNTHYSTPVVAVIKGERLVITGGGDGGVHAFKVRTGEKVWSYVIGTADVNVSPVVNGDLVYIGQGENNLTGGLQGTVICLAAGDVHDGKPKLVWHVDGIKAKFTSPIFADGRLYITNDAGTLFCLDGLTGKQHWKFHYGKNSKASPVLADGKIYVGEEDGKFHILKPEDKKCTRLHAEAFPGEIISGSPAVANGHVYFMTTEQMFCIGLKNPGKPKPLPTPVAEAPPAKGAAVAVVRVFPADVVLHPGESADLKAFGFDDHGRALGEVKVDWSLAGALLPEGLPPPPPGAPSPPALKGSLSAMKDSVTTKLTIGAPPPPSQFGRVLAKHGAKIQGEVRVRVVPKLPYKPDFSKIPVNRTPGGWVNTQGKFGVAKLPDGTFALKKLALNPNALLNRANAYIGQPTMHDYTVETDMMGTQVGEDLPDGGIIVNRYTLMLAGQRKQLRLTAWEALPRIDKVVPMEFKPKVWYHLKLTVDLQGTKGIVRGKIWETGKPEPKAWTIEAEDPIPQKEGSPGLYAFATGITPPKVGTEVYFKNVAITANKPAAAPAEKGAAVPQEAAAAVVECAPTVECVCPSRPRLFGLLRRR